MKNTLKRTLALITAVSVLSLAGCGATNETAVYTGAGAEQFAPQTTMHRGDKYYAADNSIADAVGGAEFGFAEEEMATDGYFEPPVDFISPSAAGIVWLVPQYSHSITLLSPLTLRSPPHILHLSTAIYFTPYLLKSIHIAGRTELNLLVAISPSVLILPLLSTTIIFKPLLFVRNHQQFLLPSKGSFFKT